MPDVRLLKVLNQLRLALDPSIGKLADLFAVEAFPFLSVQLFKKFEDKNWVHKVNERISHIAFVLLI